MDGEGTKSSSSPDRAVRLLCRVCIEQFVSFAEFVRLKGPQNWIRENLPAAILKAVQSVVENAMTLAAAASRPSAAGWRHS